MTDRRPTDAPGGDQARTPRVWVLLGRRHGDNAQVAALAGDLGLPTRSYRLDFNILREIPNSVLGASLASLKGPAPFVPPWPDLVVGIGRRSVPVARWIKARSGGKVRLVHLGRPRLDPRHFDLVITTPQYGLPRAANVVPLTLPYESTLNATVDGAPSPDGPVLVVLGGDSWALKLTESTVDALAEAARAAGSAAGLPIVGVTSPRTPPALGERLGALLGPDVQFYDWARENGAHNPYRAHLAAASRILLTGDSVSGIADAVWTGRPVSVLPVPEQPWLGRVRRFGGGAARRWLERGGNLGIGAPPPDMQSLYESLVDSGIARRSESGLLEITSGRARLEEERRTVVERVRSLLEG